MPGWLAVLVREQYLQCAYVERTASHATLKWLREMPFDGGPAKTIARLRASLARTTYRCNTILPRYSYQSFEVLAPKVDRSEWRDALRWVIKDGLEFPLEEALIQAMPIPSEGAPPGREPMVFAIAARRDIVTEHVHWFQRGRLPLKVISIGTMAQRNAAAMFESPGRGLAFIGIYKRGVILTFSCAASIYATRHFDWNVPALQDDAEPVARRLHVDRVLLDVQRALDSFDRQFSHIVLQRLVLTVPPGLTKLVALFKESLGLKVDIADLRQVMDTSACPELDDPTAQARWMMAIGMGLRIEETA